ncbi:MAG: flagellar biosynthesis protein FlhA [Deltaproteobacteria bacterium]|nr:flagellar biosynthesis protein FlhA [Myxococcales bacterium]MDP3213966.1 flagellar biosynthesis protein FlhA [Deltaproteobacteria bacterium]
MSTEASTPSSDRWDMVVPLGIIGIVLMMVLPVPAPLLDVLLSFSVALAVGVFLTALFIEEALEFSAFPAFVLIATLLRLSLNVATTRRILLHGAEGPSAAGHVVEAFGRFVVEGNVLVGLVVFLILAVINFVVITKGAGRVAEVAARFTLDAMPGKQMAIDADLASGAVDADGARKRRKVLEREADFFGAMDGASKFVHGDAIAGLLITAINLVGGLIMGLSSGMDLAQAGETFSVLSVGDALSTQIPALLISAAAGIVVTRSATREPIGRAFSDQLLGRPRPVLMTAGIMTVLALVPGMPAFPCLLMAGGLILASRSRTRKALAADALTAGAAESDRKRSPSEEVDAALGLETLTLEVGYELVGVVDTARGGTLLDRVAALRQQLARDLGLVMPPVHVGDNLSLQPGGYRVLILGNEIGHGLCRAGRLLAVDPSGMSPALDGERTTDPTFNMPAWWIAQRDKELAEALGYTVVDHATILATHLGELLRTHAHRLLGRQEVQHLLEVLARTAPKLVDDVVPGLIPLGDLLRVLRNLVRESVSIRDMRTILESLAEFTAQTKDVEQLTEMVRERLAPQITSRFKGGDNSVAAMTLDPALEDILRRSLRDIAAGTGGALDPSLLRSVVASAERAMGTFNAQQVTPLLVAPPDLRRYVRAIFEWKLPQLAIVSFREIEPGAPLRVIERLGPSHALEAR